MAERESPQYCRDGRHFRCRLAKDKDPNNSRARQPVSRGELRGGGGWTAPLCGCCRGRARPAPPALPRARPPAQPALPPARHFAPGAAAGAAPCVSRPPARADGAPAQEEEEEEEAQGWRAIGWRAR